MKQRTRQKLAKLLGEPPRELHERLYDLLRRPGFRVCIQTALPDYFYKDLLATYLVAVADAPCETPRRLILPAHGSAVARVLGAAQQIVERANANRPFAAKLKELSAEGTPVQVVSPDDTEWRIDPSAVVIVVGEAGDLGQRLLFSNPKDSDRQQPILAGCLGVDTLWLLTDTHLTRQLETTLEDVSVRTSSHAKPLRLWTAGPSEQDPDLAVEIADLSAEARGLLGHRRRVIIHRAPQPAGARKALQKQLKSYVDSPLRIGVYAISPQHAITLAKASKKRIKNQYLLTGTYRGAERRALDGRIAKSMASPNEDAPTVVFMTSAGLRGPLLDVDVALMELPKELGTLLKLMEHVNRSGDRVGEIHIYAAEKSLSDGQKDCLAFLEGLPTKNRRRDGSRKAVMKASPQFAPLSVTRLSNGDVDLFAMTNFDRPSSRALTYGIYEAPRTYFAWRQEVDVLAGLIPYRYSRRRETRLGILAHLIHDLCPIRGHEIASAPTHLARKVLAREYERGRKIPALLYRRGRVYMVANLLKRLGEIDDALVVVSPKAGMLDSTGLLELSSGAEVPDVAEETRLLIRPRGTSWVATRLGETETLAEGSWQFGAARKAAVALGERVGEWKVSGLVELEPPEDQETFYVAVLTKRGRPWSSYGGRTQGLAEHGEMTAKWAEALVALLGVNGETKDSVLRAAKDHDLGKDALCFKHAIGAFDSDPLAKSGNRTFRVSVNGGYAHELGSLARLHGADDLAKHLVAASHGRSRPHFEIRRFDPDISVERARQELHEGALRFDRMQRQHGHWGLAWLETLVKAADALASKHQTFPEDIQC